MLVPRPLRGASFGHISGPAGGTPTFVDASGILHKAVAQGGGGGGGGVREDGLGALSGGDGLGECPTPDRHVAQQIQSVGGPYRRPPRAGLGAT